MTQTIVLTKKNFIDILPKILELLKNWAKLKITVQASTKQQSLNELDYDEFMAKIEEEMAKEGIEFEKVSFEEAKENYLRYQKLVERFISQVNK